MTESAQLGTAFDRQSSMSLPISSLSEKNWHPLPAVEIPRAPTVAPSGARSAALDDLLVRLGTELDRGERLVDRAAGGAVPSDDAAILIAIQAGIYRYTETVDLAAKMVDATANATRAALQSGS